MTIIDIEPKHKSIVLDILTTFLPSDTIIYVFGSRAKNCAKPHSDLDIAVEIPNKKLNLSILAKLKSAFEDSLIPYTVDIIDLNNITDEFKTNIKDDLVEL